MRILIIMNGFVDWWLKLCGAVAQAHLGCIIIIKQNEYRSRQMHERIMVHETIHIIQEAELLVIGFYLVYIFNYLYNRIKGMNHDKAYRNIIFEKEAYEFEKKPKYLNKRQKYACWRK